MLVHRRVTPSIKFAGTHLHTWVERGTVRVECLAQKHNTMSGSGLEPGPLNLELSSLTMRPPRLPLMLLHFLFIFAKIKWLLLLLFTASAFQSKWWKNWRSARPWHPPTIPSSLSFTPASNSIAILPARSTIKLKYEKTEGCEQFKKTKENLFLEVNHRPTMKLCHGGSQCLVLYPTTGTQLATKKYVNRSSSRNSYCKIWCLFTQVTSSTSKLIVTNKYQQH